MLNLAFWFSLAEEKDNLSLLMLPLIFGTRSKAKTGGRSAATDHASSFIELKRVCLNALFISAADFACNQLGFESRNPRISGSNPGYIVSLGKALYLDGLTPLR